jgi:hypothetical protein
MNSLLLISPPYAWGFKAILSGKVHSAYLTALIGASNHFFLSLELVRILFFGLVQFPAFSGSQIVSILVIATA